MWFLIRWLSTSIIKSQLPNLDRLLKTHPHPTTISRNLLKITSLSCSQLQFATKYTVSYSVFDRVDEGMHLTLCPKLQSETGLQMQGCSGHPVGWDDPYDSPVDNVWWIRNGCWKDRRIKTPLGLHILCNDRHNRLFWGPLLCNLLITEGYQNLYSKPSFHSQGKKTVLHCDLEEMKTTQTWTLGLPLWSIKYDPQ